MLLCDVWSLSDAFPCAICLCLASDEGGLEPERGIIEVLASVYVCVWVSISLVFPRTHSSKPLHSRHYAFSLSIFSLSLYLARAFQLWKHNLSQPNFPFALLSLYTPANLCSPACVCAPVWVLAWSVWMQRRRKTHQVGRRWEELLSHKERVPVVLVPGFSIGTQTSAQALSGGSLLQMHMLCNNTD